MSIKFVYGRSGSGKSKYCINTIKKRLENLNRNSENKKKHIVLLVPEQLSFQSEKSLIKEIGSTGVKNVRVLSFKRMAYTVFKEVGGIARKHMDSSGKCMLLYRIMDEMKDELKVFNSAAKQQGFVNTVSEMISEFKKYNVSPEELNLIKEKVRDNSLLYNKLSDISSIYERFQYILHQGYIDTDDDLTLLNNKLDQCTFFNDAEIWIDEFKGFTPQQYLIIEKLLLKANQVTVTLNMDYEHSSEVYDETDVFAPIKYTENKLQDLAQKNGISIEKPVELKCSPCVRFMNSEELSYLEKNYFAFPFKPYSKVTEKVSIFKALNVYSEIENTASNILSLCRDRGVRFNEIAVVSRDLDRYEKIVKAVFKEYNIPYFIDRKKDITSNPIIVLITAAMEIFTRNWSYESVFKYLKTGLIDISRENIDILENYILESGIKGRKKWIDDELWYKRILSIYNIKELIEDVYKEIYGEDIKDKLGYEDFIFIVNKRIPQAQLKEEFFKEIYGLCESNQQCGEKYSLNVDKKLEIEFKESNKIKKLKCILEDVYIINSSRELIINPLINFNKKLWGRKNTREICTALYEFLEDIMVANNIEQWIEKFKVDGNQELVNEYGQIWNLIIELMDQMVEVLGEEVLSTEQFIKILSTGFGEHKMGFIPPALDQVIVSSVERLKSHNIKYLYIVGVNDGVFPSASKDEGILTDSDRGRLREENIELAMDTKAQAFEEQYLIYTTLTLSGIYLRVSYPIADHEGKSLRPSMIISRLKALFPNILEESNIIQHKDKKENLELITSEIPTFNELITVLQQAIEEESISPLWAQVYKWYKDNKAWTQSVDSNLQAFSYTNQVEKLQKEKLSSIYGDNRYFSVSRIEKYIECPFAYFIKYGLKAKERKLYNLSAPDLGTFMHNVIDKFSKTVADSKLKWSELEEQWCKEIIERKVAESMGESSGNIFNSSPKYKYFAERLKRVLVRTILLIVEHMKRSGFEPMGYEIEFGNGEEGYPPIELELSTGEKIKLIGKIDRVDKLFVEGEEYYRVIDYKSGSKDFKLSDVYYGLQMQLLTYLDAVLCNESNMSESPMFPAGVLYFKIDDPIIKSNKSISEEKIQEEIMKKLKMKGLLLADTHIIKEMDREIETHSLIIPAGIKGDGNITSKSQVATREQFEDLRAYIRSKLAKACEEMLEGEIGIHPYKKKDSTPCTYCMYSSVCEFDPMMEHNDYKLISDKKDEEIWKLIKKDLEEEVTERGDCNGRG